MDTNHSLESAILSKLDPWLRLESDSNPIPRIFTHIDDYKSAFQPKLLEEVREGVKTTLNHAIENKSFCEVEQWRALSNDSGLFSVTLTGKIPCELQASCIALLVVCTRAGCEELKIDGDAPEAYAVSVVKTVSNSYIELKSDPRVSHLWKILKGCVENSTSSARLWIIIGPKIATFSQEFEALNHVEKLSKHVLSAILNPALFTAHDNVNSRQRTIPDIEHYLERLRESFNPMQVDAIQRSIVSSTTTKPVDFPFTLVQGPPGTGKTHTIWGLLNYLHLISFQRYYDSTMRVVYNASTRCRMHRPHILVCAPSNSAVDNILERIIQYGFYQLNGQQYRPAMIRVGASGAEISKSCRDFSVESKVDALLGMSTEEWRMWYSRQLHTVTSLEKEIEIKFNELSGSRQFDSGELERISAQIVTTFDVRDRAVGDLSRLERLRNYYSKNRCIDGESVQLLRSTLEASFVDEAEIVFTTLASSGKRSLRDSTCDFQTLVVDEAAQASELSTLLPLFHGIRHCVLVGDPQQLPATVLSKGAKCARFDRSLFERLTENGIQPIVLSTQYRMHPEIRSFPSEYFYKNALIDDVDVLSCPLNFHEMNTGSSRIDFHPYLLFDTLSGVEQKNSAGSIKNEFEVQLCFKLLELLELSWIKGERPRVAVITPYAFQCHRIKQYTKPLAAQIDLTISTVDGFQGRESDVVILSCVRNAKFGMGFMLDTRRMNVALTRAKFGLWVLCSSQNAMLSPLWQALFTDASARSRIVSEKQTNNLIKFGTQR